MFQTLILWSALASGLLGPVPPGYPVSVEPPCGAGGTFDCAGARDLIQTERVSCWKNVAACKAVEKALRASSRDDARSLCEGFCQSRPCSPSFECLDVINGSDTQLMVFEESYGCPAEAPVECGAVTLLACSCKCVDQIV